MSNTINSTATINENTYNVQLGSVDDAYMSDEVDSLVCRIRSLATDDFVPFSHIEINDIYWTIGNVTPDIESYNIDGTEKVVNYQLDLFNPALDLQRVMTQSFSISQPIDTSITKATLYEKIQELTFKTDGKPFYFGVTKELKDATDTVIAEDINLSRATLLEALNALLGQINCIATCTLSSAGIYTVGIKPNEITEGTLKGATHKEITQTAADYSTAINSEVKQGVSDNITMSQRGLGLRASDGSDVVTESNCELVLQNAVQGVKSLTLNVPHLIVTIKNEDGDTQDFDLGLHRVDLTDHIIEKSAYDVKKPLPSTWTWGTISEDNKNYYVYYELGKKVIKGFNNSQNLLFGFSGNTVGLIIQKALREVAATYETDEYNRSGHTIYEYGSTTLINPYEFDDWNFDITYQAQQVQKMQVGKTIQNTNGGAEVVSPDSQNESCINLTSYGESQQTKSDRAGNKKMTIRGVVASESDLMDLGESYNNFVLVHRQKSTYPNYINYVYEMYEKYAVNNLWNGIAQQKRIYQISTDYFDRDILMKYKIKFSTAIIASQNLNIGSHQLIESIYGGLIAGFNDYAVQILYMETMDNAQNSLVTVGNYTGKAWMDTTQYASGNSIYMHFNCETNSYLGQAKEDTSSYSKGGFAQSKISYVDDNGEAASIRISSGDETTLESQYSSGNVVKSATTNLKPFVNSTINSSGTFVEDQEIYKSQNERLMVSLQFETCVDDTIEPVDMEYLASQLIIKHTNSSADIGLYCSETEGGEKTLCTITIDDYDQLTIDTGIYGIAERYLYLNDVLVMRGKAQWDPYIYIYIQR